MKLSPEQLPESGFVKLDTLEHKELVLFIRMYMKKRTKSALIYYAINILLAGGAGYYIAAGNGASSKEVTVRIGYFFFGFVLAILLIPIHEYIHVLAYKAQGAKNTSYDADLKKFYFMALADKFVASRKEFQIVALAPFVLITLAFSLALLFSNSNWTMAIIGTLLMHSSMCSGDFGLLSYLEFHKDKELVTFDDVANKITYFYVRHTEKDGLMDEQNDLNTPS